MVSSERGIGEVGEHGGRGDEAEIEEMRPEEVAARGESEEREEDHGGVR